MAKKFKLDTDQIDIKEDDLLLLDEELLRTLLIDRSSEKNIIWATDNYADLGEQFSADSHITIESITGEYTQIIQPRIKKSKEVQESRSKDKAEVFTPSWICNKQNNRIDNAFFGRENVFNEETENGWISKEHLDISEDEWRDYVKAKRLEITCGEAPYITSRYDATTGELIEPLHRIGILDRKFRVVHQFKKGDDIDVKNWFKWMKIALQSTYGYEWQGDNLLLARENILLTFIDFYLLKFPGKFPTEKQLRDVAEIISWNIWQMDGLKFVIPETCKKVNVCINQKELDKANNNLFYQMFPDDEVPMPEPKYELQDCPGCTSGDSTKHTGIYAKIRDWRVRENKYKDKNGKTGKDRCDIPFVNIYNEAINKR